jgi:rhodanese-related sulfurtransferase
MPTVNLLAAADLKRLLDSGKPLVLLDVREPVERANCALPAPETVMDLHIPMGEIPLRLDEIEAHSGRAIVVYCHHGVRSLAVARWLAARGFDHLHNLEGGIDAWSVAVDPTVPRY